jgi:predicted 3-demethylubiquinone-9 3-methyltransferase (glyoxalase superfamily)
MMGTNDNAPVQVTPFLMFEGRAEEAMKLYTSVIPGSRIVEMQKYGKEHGAAEGLVLKATFTLGGREVICIDSPAKHAFTFTPSISMFVTCASAAEVDRIFGALGEGGQVMMPLGEYPFSKRFGWTSDRFGVSWQIILV